MSTPRAPTRRRDPGRGRTRASVASLVGSGAPIFHGLASRALVGALIGALIGAPLAASATSQDESVREEVAATGPGISAADISHHVHTLASDAMAGRETGSAGGAAAAASIAGVLERAGLQPAGDAGYLQTTDARGFTRAGAASMVAFDGDGQHTPGVEREDFVLFSVPPMERELDVIVAHTSAEVPRTPRADAALFIVAGRRHRTEWLEEAGTPGAVGWGLMLVPGPNEIGDYFPPRTHIAYEAGPGAGPPIVLLLGQMREAFSMDRIARMSITVPGGESRPAHNVVAILPGVGTEEHPELAAEAVVITAHYDHVGMGVPTPPADESADDAERDTADDALGDALGALGGALGDDHDHDSDDAEPEEEEDEDLVYNGADDDASGVAAVLELAEAFAAGPAPARTLVFLLVTGEEHGLLGTEYYLDNPVVPLERTVANVNFEMIGRPDAIVGGPGKFWLTGFERSNLGPSWVEAGLDISPDGRPEQNFFMRSDNYAFVQRGIVAQTLSSYDLHEDYHTVDDEADRLDYEHMEAGIRVSLQAVKALADGSLSPQWTEDEPAGR